MVNVRFFYFAIVRVFFKRFFIHVKKKELKKKEDRDDLAESQKFGISTVTS